jgi:pimeloyl-ACP methyl ester carboxylesterase
MERTLQVRIVNVLAFHGQGSSPARMKYDMGNPNWVTYYPDWKRFRGAEHFAEAHSFRDVVLIGYSLGGEFIAELTRTSLASKIRGIVVYESPVRRGPPRPLGCKVKIIWNNYDPWFRWRKAKKVQSIYQWTRAFPNAEKLIGRHTSHVKRIPVAPWFGQAWDVSLNLELRGWVERCEYNFAGERLKELEGH